MNITLWLGVTTAWGTFKGGRIRKTENHCIREYIGNNLPITSSQVFKYMLRCCFYELRIWLKMKNMSFFYVD